METELQKAAHMAVVSEAVANAILSRDVAIQAIKFAIKNAIAVGRMLRAAKAKLKHGQFQPWIEACNLCVSYETCRKWMKIAEQEERDGGQFLENARSMREIYTNTQLLPDNEETTSAGKVASTGNSYLTFLTRSSTHLQAQLSQRPLDQWALEDRRILKSRLEPLVKIYESLLS